MDRIKKIFLRPPHIVSGFNVALVFTNNSQENTSIQIIKFQWVYLHSQLDDF